MRLFAPSGFQGFGADVRIYRHYVLELDARGFGGFAAVCERYVAQQREPGTAAELPPTRFLFLATTWVAKRLAFGDAPPATAATPNAKNRDPVLVSLKRVTRWFAVLTLGVIGIAAWRMLGPPVGTGTLALAATSPLAIHMGAHPFVDGFFAFWATLCVWLLWENLQRARDPWRLVALGFALAFLVMAKESALFVFIALAVALAANHWLKFGTITPPLIGVMLAAPFAGVLVLMALAGGPGVFVEIYQLFAARSQTLPYAITHQDGPWYRYLLDLLTLDPLVFLLAISGVTTVAIETRGQQFLLVFAAISFALMCNIPYGLNLRFATIWLLPLCAFAAAQLIAVAMRAGHRAALAGVVLFAAVCAYDLRQYQIIFVDHPIYDVTSASMLRAVDIIKDAPKP